MVSSDKALKVLGSDNELFGLILTVLILAVILDLLALEAESETGFGKWDVLASNKSDLENRVHLPPLRSQRPG